MSHLLFTYHPAMCVCVYMHMCLGAGIQEEGITESKASAKRKEK